MPSMHDASASRPAVHLPCTAPPWHDPRVPDDLLAAIGARRKRYAVTGGTAAAVIDLAGGPSPRLVIIDGPQRLLVRDADVHGALHVVHSAPGLDAALIGPPLDPCPPRGGYLVDGCTGCIPADVHLEDLDHGGRVTGLVITHQPGCPELDRLLRKTGERR